MKVKNTVMGSDLPLIPYKAGAGVSAGFRL